MEKEGLERVLNFLHHHELSVAVIVTDRHKQINKWLRETHPKIKHYMMCGTLPKVQIKIIIILCIF